MAEAKGYDWPILFKEYKSSKLTQRQWCVERSMNETDTARHFAELRRQEAERFKEKAFLILASSGPLAARTVKGHLTSEDDNVSLKAGFGILGAIGLSPQAAAIQINNNNSNQVAFVMAPIFAAPAASIVDSFLGAKSADTESDS